MLENPTPTDPLAMTQLPTRQWVILSIDFYGPQPTGEDLLVVFGRYSGFPEVEIVGLTKASVAIPKLGRIFPMHGSPTDIRSENGPPFNGKDYPYYLDSFGIQPKFSTLK